MTVIKSILALFILLVTPLHLKAEIWAPTAKWDEAWEKSYQQWIKGQSQQTIFSNPASKFYGIKTDCADMIVIMRAIFAFEHKLTFEVSDSQKNLYSHSLKQFDSIKDDLERFKAFANLISLSLGTDALARENSISVSLKDLTIGDIYLANWIDNSGKTNSHVYLITDILPTGDLTLMSSTTPRAIRTLSIRKGPPLNGYPGPPYGFRRPIFNSKIIKKNQQSEEQYSINQKSGFMAVYNEIKNKHKIEEDTYQKNILRRFENICQALETRKQIIQMSQMQMQQKHCFWGPDYEEFSTTSRDRFIATDIDRIIEGWKKIQTNPQHGIESWLVEVLNYLSSQNFVSMDESNWPEGKIRLYQLCPFKFDDADPKSQLGIDLFYQRYWDHEISDNPNDHILKRWGLSGPKTICQ